MAREAKYCVVVRRSSKKKHADNKGDDRNQVDIGGGFRCGKLGNAVIIKAVAKQADNNAQIKMENKGSQSGMETSRVTGLNSRGRKVRGR